MFKHKIDNNVVRVWLRKRLFESYNQTATIPWYACLDTSLNHIKWLAASGSQHSLGNTFTFEFNEYNCNWIIGFELLAQSALRIESKIFSRPFLAELVYFSRLKIEWFHFELNFEQCWTTTNRINAATHWDSVAFALRPLARCTLAISFAHCAQQKWFVFAHT